MNYDHLVQNMSLIMLGSNLKTQESTLKLDKNQRKRPLDLLQTATSFMLRSNHVLCIFFGSIFNVSETKNDNYIKLDMISRCAAGPRRHAKLVFPLISTTPRQWLQLNPCLGIWVRTNQFSKTYPFFREKLLEENTVRFSNI